MRIFEGFKEFFDETNASQLVCRERAEVFKAEGFAPSSCDVIEGQIYELPAYNRERLNEEREFRLFQ